MRDLFSPLALLRTVIHPGDVALLADDRSSDCSFVLNVVIRSTVILVLGLVGVADGAIDHSAFLLLVFFRLALAYVVIGAGPR